MVRLPGHFSVLRQTLKPARAPVGPEHALHLLAQPFFDRRDQLRDAFVILQRPDMVIEIARSADAATQRVDLWPRKAIQRVELHWAQRRAELDQLFRRLIEFAALVVRAN